MACAARATHTLTSHSGVCQDQQLLLLLQGPDHPDLGLICQEMALLMERTKRLPEARDLLQRGLDIRAVSALMLHSSTLPILRFTNCNDDWMVCSDYVPCFVPRSHLKTSTGVLPLFSVDWP